MVDRPRPSSISTNPEDAAGYRRGAKSGKSSGTARRRSGSGGGGKMIGINLILAVLIAGLVIAGWFIANQHQLLTAEKQALDAAESRIAVLEDRLRVTHCSLRLWLSSSLKP